MVGNFLAHGEIDVYSLVQELQEKFSSLNMTSLTSVNDWFQSGMFIR